MTVPCLYDRKGVLYASHCYSGNCIYKCVLFSYHSVYFVNLLISVYTFFRMILSVKSEAAKSEDMFAQIEEIIISVRLAFLNCFLDFAGTNFNQASLIISSCKHRNAGKCTL